MQHALFLWASTITLSVAPLEYQHGRNRRRAHHNQHWPHFVAQSVNAEQKLQLAMHKAGLEEAVSASQRKRQQRTHGDDGHPKRSRQESAYSVFRQEEIDRRKALGHKVHVTSSEFRKSVKDGWQ